ncbi:PqqD family peptide modification chaperone [Chondromyces crocatus]|uniref:PqqD family peptide modification chaperone n=1 Tax=Chondromyces crocatus TaxID=52 RepID=A0A0K1ERI9_CHOCO|nr:PqqD family peptide modification chaperone [Chondromyces crocatus]AKT43456.1 uncharacterized protein CMC5_076880 [Chondromyces crocatus]
MTSRAVALCADLPSLEFRLALRLEGLPLACREALEARWPEAMSGASHPAERSRIRLVLEASGEGVGLPSSALVTVELAWRSARRAVLRTNGAELELEVGDGEIQGQGWLDGARSRGAVDAVVRAVTTLALMREKVLLLHAAAVEVDGEGVVLLGRSGAGKTTTARRLGREGMRRLSDDMIAVDLSREPPRLHRLPFERAGRARVDASDQGVPCRGGAWVNKGATALGAERHGDPVRGWVESVIALPPAPSEAHSVLDAVGRLRALPLWVLEVPPAGALSSGVRRWMDGLREGARIPLDGPLVSLQARAAGGTEGGAPESMGEQEQMQRVERSPNVAWRILDGVAVLVVPSSPAIQTLNEVGSLVWQLADGRSLDAIVDAVVREFEVEEAQARADVEHFVSELEGLGMLRRVPETR